MIPRDLECYYCRKGQHDHCALPKTCACRTCYPRPVAVASSLSLYAKNALTLTLAGAIAFELFVIVAVLR
jgi:hypothetical protein